jgi:hypothetical protein
MPHLWDRTFLLIRTILQKTLLPAVLSAKRENHSIPKSISHPILPTER